MVCDSNREGKGKEKRGGEEKWKERYGSFLTLKCYTKKEMEEKWGKALGIFVTLLGSVNVFHDILVSYLLHLVKWCTQNHPYVFTLNI